MADIKYTMPPTEDVEQMCLFRWADAQSGKYPELSLMYHMQRCARLHRPSQSMADAGEHHRPGHCFESGELPVCLPRLPQQN